jgi:beta-N-acetylhexosaminidase
VVAAAAAAFAAGAAVGATAGGGAQGDPLAGSGAGAASSGEAQSGARGAGGANGVGDAKSGADGASGAGGTSSAVARLPLERQVGLLVVLRFKGPAVPAYVRRALHSGHAAGAILFHDNVRDPAQLRALTHTLRGAGGPGTIVAVDQEGGPIRILPWAPPARAGPAQGSQGTAGADARAAAIALRSAGVNVSLAPVADVPSTAGSGARA